MSFCTRSLTLRNSPPMVLFMPEYLIRSLRVLREEPILIREIVLVPGCCVSNFFQPPWRLLTADPIRRPIAEWTRAGPRAISIGSWILIAFLC
jgi:hypothetical protein